jgi:hypothetical protein
VVRPGALSGGCRLQQPSAWKAPWAACSQALRLMGAIHGAGCRRSRSAPDPDESSALLSRSHYVPTPARANLAMLLLPATKWLKTSNLSECPLVMC